MSDDSLSQTPMQSGDSQDSALSVVPVETTTTPVASVPDVTSALVESVSSSEGGEPAQVVPNAGNSDEPVTLSATELQFLRTGIAKLEKSQTELAELRKFKANAEDKSLSFTSKDEKTIKDGVIPFTLPMESEGAFTDWSERVRYLVQRFPRLAQFPEEVVFNSLSGEPNTWFLKNVSRKKAYEKFTLEQFISLVEKRYIVATTYARLRELVQSRIFDGESAARFEQAAVNWLEKSPEEIMLDLFLGACSPVYEDRFRVYPPKDMQEALQWIQSHPLREDRKNKKRQREEPSDSSRQHSSSDGVRCSFCKIRGHTVERCFKKNPALKTQKRKWGKFDAGQSNQFNGAKP